MAIKKYIRSALPPALLVPTQRAKRSLVSLAWRTKHPGNKYSCPFCSHNFGKFIPYVNPYAITLKADIVSGQSTEAHNCPFCFSSERERGLFFYFKKHLPFDGKKILHFAPEKSIHGYISPLAHADYICGDLNPKAYSAVSRKVKKINMLHTGYADNYFDVVIANHVMEHIPDDVDAMKELCRVLKPGGSAILMVPIGAKLDSTFEDNTKVTEDEKAHGFGQLDHVRIYAENDYMRRLKSAGFKVKAEPYELSAKDLDKYGINPREKIYVASK